MVGKYLIFFSKILFFGFANKCQRKTEAQVCEKIIVDFKNALYCCVKWSVNWLNTDYSLLFTSHPPNTV